MLLRDEITRAHQSGRFAWRGHAAAVVTFLCVSLSGPAQSQSAQLEAPSHPATSETVAERPAASDGALAAGVPMSDEQLAAVEAGDFSVALDGFDVMIQDNQAGQFTMDIAQNAFDGARGLFTTLQAVNSAVDLTVIVNIYLSQQSS